MRKIAKIFLVTIAILVVVAVTLAVRIYSFGNIRSNESADAAIVLGAAVWSSGVSPVFRERINHGVGLYRTGMLEPWAEVSERLRRNLATSFFYKLDSSAAHDIEFAGSRHRISSLHCNNRCFNSLSIR